MTALLGLLVLVLGFALRGPTLLVVLLASVATGMGAGFTPAQVLGLIGTFFVENRFMSLPLILLLPCIGVLERHGLQERAAAWVRGRALATAGRLFFTYQLLRELTSMVGLTIGGHASMVRPLIAPMAEAAGRVRAGGALPPALARSIRAHAAAAENWGNFFADDILVAIGPVLLMKGVFEAAGVAVSIRALGLWGLPTAVAALGFGAWRYARLDRAIVSAGRAAHATTESRRTSEEEGGRTC